MPEPTSVQIPVTQTGPVKPAAEPQTPPQTPPATPPATPPQTPPQTPPATPPQPPAELDMAPFEAEFARDGKLSDESYKKLADEYRLPKALVDGYISSQQAAVQQFHNEVYTSVGGQEQYNAMTAWAQSLPANEQQAYNQIMASGDREQIKIAVQGLNARFTAAYGSRPNLVQGKPGPASSVVPFRSTQELTAAMRDPRYKSGDPAYVSDVQARLAASNIF